jgi:hypothetical protein
MTSQNLSRNNTKLDAILKLDNKKFQLSNVRTSSNLFFNRNNNHSAENSTPMKPLNRSYTTDLSSFNEVC